MSVDQEPANRIFDEAPELLRGLNGAATSELRAMEVAVIAARNGPWEPPAPTNAGRGHFGLLVLEGLLLRRVTLNGRTGAELLGAGDLLQPWALQPPYETLSTEAGWEVLDSARLAVLDDRFATRVAPWPDIAAALIARSIERSRALAFQHVASHLPGLEGRLLALMWALADRWGRVTRDGVLVPVRLTHATLAELVGASRPSVSTALARLAREGVLSRNASGWVLEREGAVQ